MTTDDPTAPAASAGHAVGRVFELVQGIWAVQVLAAAVRLGIPDRVADAPSTSGELAAALGADPDALDRLLRACASLGLVEHLDGTRFSGNEVTGALCNRPGSLRDMVLSATGPGRLRPVERLDEAVVSGRATAKAALGEEWWDYFGHHPEEGATFARWMSALSAMTADQVAATVDLSPYRRIVDVGGGHGVLLRRLLAVAPHAHGVLFDLPEVVAGATDTGPDARFEKVGGDFFADVPPGGDCYLLQHILHDWNDDNAGRILAACHRAADRDASLLVIEHLLPEQIGPPVPYLLDLAMLAYTGGRERTREHYQQLLSHAGFELDTVSPLQGGQAVLHTRKVHR